MIHPFRFFVVERKDAKGMKNKRKAFTLGELLAVIAILAIILLIAVPMILGVIEEAREKSFRLSILNVFNAVELEYATTGSTGGQISKLPMNNNTFLSGEWDLDEDSGTITIRQACDGSYKVGSLTDQVGD